MMLVKKTRLQQPRRLHPAKRSRIHVDAQRPDDARVRATLLHPYGGGGHILDHRHHRHRVEDAMIHRTMGDIRHDVASSDDVHQIAGDRPHVVVDGIVTADPDRVRAAAHRQGEAEVVVLVQCLDGRLRKSQLRRRCQPKQLNSLPSNS